MADMRQHGQSGAGNERRGDFAVGRGRGDLVGVAQKDRDRKPHPLEAFRIEALDDARGHHKRGPHSRDAEIVLGVGELRGAGGFSEERFRVRARELKLLLRRADSVVGMGVAEFEKAGEVHPRARLHQRREAAGRKARGAEPAEIQMRRKRGIAFHGLERRREVARPLPEEHGARDRHRVAPIVARMVDGDHDIAMPRQSRSEPCHDPRRAAEAVRQQDRRARESVLKRGVERGRAGYEERRLAGRADVERRLDRIGRGRIPDRDPEIVLVRGVADDRRSLMRDEMALADFRGCGGPGRERREQHRENCNRKPCSHLRRLLPNASGHSSVASSGFPSRPARSWMNCQAVRPEREPRVVAHSSASASS